VFIWFFKEQIANWGKHSQVKQLIEEMAELITALIHYEKYMDNKTFEKVLEEIGDVELCLEQLKYIFGCDEKIVESIMSKVKRATNRLINPSKYWVQKGIGKT